MRTLGLQGIRRSKGIRTTTWVMDFSYVRCWTGWVHVAFVVDVFAQKIVAWNAATTKDVDLVMTPIRMATWQRAYEGHPVVPGQLIGHADAGSQYTAIRLTEHSTCRASVPRSDQSATPTTTPSSTA